LITSIKGKRSVTAAKDLISNGYEDVIIVEGGLQQWVLEGLPVKQEIASKCQTDAK